MRIFLEKVVDHGLGVVDVAATVSPVWTVFVVAEDVGVETSLREIKGRADAFLFCLWWFLHVPG